MASDEEFARICKVLSVPTRVRIIDLLKGRALCVNALAGRIDVTQGAVSQHLRVLRDAGLVTAEKRGYFVHYQLDEGAIAKWRGQLDRFLQGCRRESDPCRKASAKKERTASCPKQKPSAGSLKS